MTVDEFVKRIGECAPRTEQLVAKGFSPPEAEKFQESFFFRPRAKSNVEPHDDPILDLIGCYHCGHVEIGFISFGEVLQENEDFWVVGKAEADPLCIKKLTGEVLVLELGTNDHVIFNCALNGSSFLDALAFAESSRPRFWEDNCEGLKTSGESVVQSCLSLARGKKSESFYRTLLNVW